MAQPEYPSYKESIILTEILVFADKCVGCEVQLVYVVVSC